MKNSTDELNEVSRSIEFLHIQLARNPIPALLVDGAYAQPSPYTYVDI